MPVIIVVSLNEWCCGKFYNIQDTFAKLFHTTKYNTVPYYHRKHQLSTATVGRKVAADRNVYSKQHTKFFKLKL